MASQKEIRERRKELDRRMAEARQVEEHVMVDYRALENECTHPKAYTYYAMGEPGRKCPDCGYQT